MKNFLIILGILGGIFIIALAFVLWQFKDVDFGNISNWFGKTETNQNQEFNKNENLNFIEESDIEDWGDENLEDGEDIVEDVGELNFYTLELGRSDADIQSKRTYTFYLPVDIVYELQGVDASSGVMLFKKDGQEIFRLSNFDYVRPDDQIEEYWPDAAEYTTEGGHTNILELLDENYEDEMYIFADTLKINDEPAFVY